MSTSSFLTLAGGQEVRFDFTPDAGQSSLGFQLLGDMDQPLGPETTVFKQALATDVVQQVDGFSDAALTGGGFVVAYEVHGGQVASQLDQTVLKTAVYDAQGRQVGEADLPLGAVPHPGGHLNLGAFALGGDGYAVVYDHGALDTEHLAFSNGGGLTDLALKGPVFHVDNSGGQLALGFADGSQVIVGGAGADAIHAGGHGDLVRAGDGADTVQGGAGRDDINGNAGDDVIQGGGGDDVLRGGRGFDALDGGAGNDWISGDKGDDTETGGAGADTFHGALDGGFDVITDFNAAEGDRISLDAGTPFFVFQHGQDVAILLGTIDNGAFTSLIELKDTTLADLPPGFITLG